MELHPQDKANRKREYDRARYQKNRETVLAIHAEYRAKNKEKVMASIKKWRCANKDRVLQQNAAWKLQNREKVKIDNAEWRAANKDKTRAYWHTYRARKIAGGGALSNGLFDRLMDAQKGLCAFCSVCLLLTGTHMDHIQPLSKGGFHADQNIQLLCPTCNRRKGAKDLIEFAQSNGRLL